MTDVANPDAGSAEKFILKSKTVWGVILAALPTMYSMLQAFGIDLGPTFIQDVTGLADKLFEVLLLAVGLGGSFWAFYGRLTAKTAVTTTMKKGNT